MSRALILVLCLLSFEVAARPVWSMGTGLEGRLQRELNTDFSEMKALGQLFAQTYFGRWGVMIEAGQEERQTSRGGLSIDSTTTSVGAWGRYALLTEKAWLPFVGTGLGMNFDTVKSSFGASSTKHDGRRGFAGVGAGVGRTFVDYLFVEGEARASLVEEEIDPVLSVFLRVGVSI